MLVSFSLSDRLYFVTDSKNFTEQKIFFPSDFNTSQNFSDTVMKYQICLTLHLGLSFINDHHIFPVIHMS